MGHKYIQWSSLQLSSFSTTAQGFIQDFELVGEQDGSRMIVVSVRAY